MYLLHHSHRLNQIQSGDCQNPKRPQKRGLHCTQTAAEDRCWSRGQQHLFAAGISFKELLLEGSMTQTAGNLIFRVELQCPTSALV